MTSGFERPLYILPFDQRESFETRLFGWTEDDEMGNGRTLNTNFIASAQQERTMLNYLFADSVYATLHQFVSAYKVHPILVNFTAGLIPVSVGSDILARVFGKQTLRDTGWWTLCFAAVITPFTAITGWLFWMKDDIGVPGMTIHKWLGTSVAVLLVGLVLWRWWFFKRNSQPSVSYLLVALAVVGAVVYQGHLGGDQSFGAMSEARQQKLLTDIDTQFLHLESAEIGGFVEQQLPSGRVNGHKSAG